LPQETGRLFGFALVANRLAAAAAQRIVMVLRLKFALRAAEPVVGCRRQRLVRVNVVPEVYIDQFILIFKERAS